MNTDFLNKHSSNIFGPILTWVFWFLLFTLPVFFQYYNNQLVNWEVIINVWIDYLPLFTVFLVNRYILIPKILLKSQIFIYIISVTVLISLTVFGSYSFRQQLNTHKTFTQHRKSMLQLPDSQKVKKERRPQQQRRLQQEQRRPQQQEQRIPPRQLQQQQQIPTETFPPYVNLILLSILLVGFDTGMNISVKWAQTLQQKAEIEKENIKNELAFLRNQISPHFLMNTLNNIHSLIDFDTKEAKNSIIKLSTLMRHLLYESDENPTFLAKEVEFIVSYVELMKLRFNDDVDIKLILPEVLPSITIQPLLFTNIIENAFKYGISYENKSFVHINLSINNNELEFSVVNSSHKNKKTTDQSGIGIKNTEKRLKLLYNNNYTFTYTEKENVYSSTIKIPI